MRRREFITLVGSAAAWPLAAHAEQTERIRRIGVLMNAVADDAEVQSYLAAFRQEMQRLRWIEGRNVQLDTRWGAGDAARTRRYAAELVALSPDLILAAGGPVAAAVRSESGTVPVVLAQSIDPVGAGIVASLARPGGNSTGFMQFEYSLSGKWPELLKEIAPRVKRVAVLRDTSNPAGIGQWAVMQAMAPSFGMELSPVGILEVAEIERGVAAFARGAGGGMVVPVSARAVLHRQSIIAQAARHRLPTIYPYRSFVVAGGPDLIRA